MDEIEVVLSEGNHIDMKPDMAERRRLFYALIHPHFNNPRRYNNDIALLRLDRPLRINRTPICLPDPGRGELSLFCNIYFRNISFMQNVDILGRTYSGEMAQVLGWGLTSENGTKSSSLLKATVPILSKTTCASLSGFMKITDGMMCASPLAGGVDACQVGQNLI